MRETVKQTGFWFKLGLRYFRDVSPDQMDRQLILLGLHYASQGQTKDAEYIYQEAIRKLEAEGNRCFSLVMAKHLYGRLLIRDKSRQDLARTHLQQSEGLAAQLPFWWEKLDHVVLSGWELD